QEKATRSSLLAMRKKIDTFFDRRLTVKPMERRRGLAEFFGLKPREPFVSAFSSLLMTRFVFADNAQGILPLFVRAMQNNYQGGIKSFEFKRTGERLYLSVTEGDTEYEYKIGFYDYLFTDLDFCGEKYTVGAIANARQDESGEYTYDFEFIFPELPNTRTLSLKLNANGTLTVRMNEIPDSKIAASFIDSIPAMSPKISFALGMLESNLGKNFIERRISELFSPTIYAVSNHAEEFNSLLEYENYRVKEKLSSLGMVRMLISRFTGADTPEPDENKKAPSLGGMLISSLLGKLFSRGSAKDEDEES
ncbi:MAG: hypothetical protein J6U68_00235, partial [Clostridia bacterium]|nr:hypothetical protein [Clostridia bacterium]